MSGIISEFAEKMSSSDPTNYLFTYPKLLFVQHVNRALLQYTCKQGSRPPWPPGVPTVVRELLGLCPRSSWIHWMEGFHLGLGRAGSQGLRRPSMGTQARNNQSWENEGHMLSLQGDFPSWSTLCSLGIVISFHPHLQPSPNMGTLYNIAAAITGEDLSES